jgi:hypothetical protein
MGFTVAEKKKITAEYAPVTGKHKKLKSQNWWTSIWPVPAAEAENTPSSN